MRPLGLMTIVLLAATAIMAYAEASQATGPAARDGARTASGCKLGWRYSSYYRKCVRLLPLV